MSPAKTTSANRQRDLSAIPRLLQSAIDQGALSGIVTLVWQGGDILQLNTLGQRNLATGAPMTRDTLFQIASMTKPITSLATLMLMEEGKLALTDPITKFLPEFSNMRVIDDPVGPISQTSPAAREITIDDLLTHRAGLAYNFTTQGELGKAYDQQLGATLAVGISPDEWLARIGALPLAYPPGERMHYSHATDVLGCLIARIENKPLFQVLKQRIFDPLGMADTCFWLPEDKRDRLAVLYQASPDGLTDVSRPIKPVPPLFQSGGGGLISSLDDYLKFARLMLGRGTLDNIQLARPETVDLMTANHLTPAQLQIPFLGLPYWESMGFGLGVSTIMHPDRHAAMGAGAAGAFGWPGAFGTWWQADPVNDLILIYLIQDSINLTAEAITASRQRSAMKSAFLADFQKLAYAALQ